MKSLANLFSLASLTLFTLVVYSASFSGSHAQNVNTQKMTQFSGVSQIETSLRLPVPLQKPSSSLDHNRKKTERKPQNIISYAPSVSDSETMKKAPFKKLLEPVDGIKESLNRICELPDNSVSIGEPIVGEGGCGIEDPVSLEQLDIAGEKIGFSRVLMISCQAAQQLVPWVVKANSAVKENFENEQLESLQIAAGYACRRRNNLKSGKLSEHAKGNAIDVVGFKLKSGRIITVLKGWEDSSEHAFLKTLHGEACKQFTTVLGPMANKYHKDHFHFDIGCHGKDCKYLICE
ncbi:extensin family protein [Polycladidibacter stylochi]|uniref:extensin-like domain-containing protein n=1 Tax=Polycladidibacter stylochi TaxID=1807766 RepID=UPI00083113BF|nr:extensin family protein [Pseudovibrio stylochi]